MRKDPKIGSSFLTKTFMLLALAAVIFILFAVARQTYKKKQIQNEIDKLQDQARQIEKENLEIQEKIIYLESRDYQEKEAKDKLNLQNPDENVVIIKPGLAKEPLIDEKKTSVPAPELNIPNPIKWWNYFFKY